MKVEQTVCDVCGKKKGEANKWLQAVRYPNGGRSHATGIWIGQCSINDDVILDLCSDTCLQKVLGEILVQLRKASENETT